MNPVSEDQLTDKQRAAHRMPNVRLILTTWIDQTFRSVDGSHSHCAGRASHDTGTLLKSLFFREINLIATTLNIEKLCDRVLIAQPSITLPNCSCRPDRETPLQSFRGHLPRQSRRFASRFRKTQYVAQSIGRYYFLVVSAVCHPSPQT